MWHLDTRRSLHEEIQVQLAVGPMNTVHSHRVFSMHWPRGGHHFFWEAISLYTCLQMKAYGGKRTVWLFRQKAVWWKTFLSMVGSEVHYTPGSATRPGSESTARHDDGIRLPTGALSTFGLLVVLSGMASSMHHQAGGVKGSDLKAAAKFFLHGLVDAACFLQATFDIPIYSSASWSPSWPCEEECAPDFVLNIIGGAVAVKNLRAQLVLKAADKAWVKVWSMMEEGFGRDLDTLRLLDFILLLLSEQKLKQIAAQVVWALSRKLELVTLTSLRRGLPAEAPLQVRVAPLIDVAWHRQRLDQEISKHLVACRHLSTGLRNFSIPTDKANVGGPSLQNSIVVLADGSALVQAPQAGNWAK